MVSHDGVCAAPVPCGIAPWAFAFRLGAVVRPMALAGVFDLDRRNSQTFWTGRADSSGGDGSDRSHRLFRATFLSGRCDAGGRATSGGTAPLIPRGGSAATEDPKRILRSRRVGGALGGWPGGPRSTVVDAPEFRSCVQNRHRGRGDSRDVENETFVQPIPASVGGLLCTDDVHVRLSRSAFGRGRTRLRSERLRRPCRLCRPAFGRRDSGGSSLRPDAHVPGRPNRVFWRRRGSGRL